MDETTLVALRSDTGERVTISDISIEELRILSDAHLLLCPFCNSPVTLKAGPVRVHHFAHASLADCSAIDHEPESDSHRQGKLLLYHTFRQGAIAARLEQHLPATAQRADVFIHMSGELKYALELQQATDSVGRWLERHRLD